MEWYGVSFSLTAEIRNIIGPDSGNVCQTGGSDVNNTDWLAVWSIAICVVYVTVHYGLYCFALKILMVLIGECMENALVSLLVYDKQKSPKVG